MNSMDVTEKGHYVYYDDGKPYVRLEDYEELEKELKRLKEQK